MSCLLLKIQQPNTVDDSNDLFNVDKFVNCYDTSKWNVTEQEMTTSDIHAFELLII